MVKFSIGLIIGYLLCCVIGDDVSITINYKPIVNKIIRLDSLNGRIFGYAKKDTSKKDSVHNFFKK